jgi:hypothetical protein
MSEFKPLEPRNLGHFTDVEVKTVSNKSGADYPATCMVHWPTGPVPACDKHARSLVAIGRFLGSHIATTQLHEPTDCQNCINESSKVD